MDLLKARQKLSILFQKEDSLVEIACVISALLEDRIVIDLPQYFMTVYRIPRCRLQFDY